MTNITSDLSYFSTSELMNINDSSYCSLLIRSVLLLYFITLLSGLLLHWWLRALLTDFLTIMYNSYSFYNFVFISHSLILLFISWFNYVLKPTAIIVTTPKTITTQAQYWLNSFEQVNYIIPLVKTISATFHSVMSYNCLFECFYIWWLWTHKVH